MTGALGKIAKLFFVCAALLSISHCGSDSEPPKSMDRGAERIISIGLTPEQNIFKQIERYEPVADYLGGKIGCKIKLIVLTRYGNIVDNFVSTGLDGAFFGSFTYAKAHVLLGIEPIARPVDMDGGSTYHGIIIVRKDSGIKSINDMKGKRFAFVDSETTAGYLFPMIYFYQHGITDINSFLKEAYFAGTHEDVIYDVLNKKADVGAEKNTVLERLAVRDSAINENLVILARSPEVPENSLAVRSDMDNDLKKALQQSMLGMHEDPVGKEILKKFGAQKFIETKDEDYEAVYKYAKEIHLDLTTYDYARAHDKAKTVQ